MAKKIFGLDGIDKSPIEIKKQQNKNLRLRKVSVNTQVEEGFVGGVRGLALSVMSHIVMVSTMNPIFVLVNGVIHIALTSSLNEKRKAVRNNLDRIDRILEREGYVAGYRRREIEEIRTRIKDRSLFINGVLSIVPIVNVLTAMNLGSANENACNDLIQSSRELENLIIQMNKKHSNLEIKTKEGVPIEEFCNNYSLEEFDEDSDKEETPLLTEKEEVKFTSDDITSDPEQAEEMKEVADKVTEEEEDSGFDDTSEEMDQTDEDEANEDGSEEPTEDTPEEGESKDGVEETGEDFDDKMSVTDVNVEESEPEGEEQKVAQEAFTAYKEIINLSKKKQLTIQDQDKVQMCKQSLGKFMRANNISPSIIASESATITHPSDLHLLASSYEVAVLEQADPAILENNPTIEGFFDFFKKPTLKDSLVTNHIDYSNGWPEGQFVQLNYKYFRYLPHPVMTSGDLTPCIEYLRKAIMFMDTCRPLLLKREYLLDKFRNDLLIMTMTNTTILFSVKVRDIPVPPTNIRKEYSSATFGILNKIDDVKVPSLDQAKELRSLIDEFTDKGNALTVWARQNRVALMNPFSVELLLTYNQGEQAERTTKAMNKGDTIGSLHGFYNEYQLAEYEDAFNSTIDEARFISQYIGFMSNGVTAILNRVAGESKVRI